MLSTLLRPTTPERWLARPKAPAVIAVTRAVRRPDLTAVALLMRGFRDGVRRLYAARPWVATRYFDELAWQREVDSLPGAYDAPRGALLLARVDGTAAGCVALRPMPDSDGIAEVKRLFVHPRYQKLGLGRALMVRLLHEAGERGYRRVVLETGLLQVDAQRLYRSLGFRPVAPYHDVPRDLARELLFFGLELNPDHNRKET